MTAATRLAIFALALIFALRLDVYLFRTGLAPVPPVVLVGCLCAMAALYGHRFHGIVRSPTWQYALATVVLAMLGFAAPGQTELGWNALSDGVLAFLFISAWLVLLAGQGEHRTASRALVTAFVVAALLNGFEVLRPMTFSEVAGRSAGFFQNPNLAASALLMGAAYLGTTAASGRQLLVILGISGAGVLVTFSRAAVVIWVCLTFWFAWQRGSTRPAVLILVPACAALVLAATFHHLPASILAEANVAHRLAFLQGRVTSDQSTSERWLLAERSLDHLEERPLFGHGPGRSGSITLGATTVGTHNEFLAVCVDYGLIGLLVWLAYLSRFARRETMALFLVLALSAMSFHSVLLNRQTLLMLALFEARRFLPPQAGETGRS